MANLCRAHICSQRQDQDRSEEAKEGVRYRLSRNVAVKKVGKVATWFHRQLKDPWSLSKAPTRRVSKIDIYARKIFPLAFATFNFFYWIGFMYYIGDDDPQRKESPVQMTTA